MPNGIGLSWSGRLRSPQQEQLRFLSSIFHLRLENSKIIRTTYESKMLLVLSLCLFLVTKTCQAQAMPGTEHDDAAPAKENTRQCIDNDALTSETFAAIESAIKVSQYGRQDEKLKALERLEKHVSNMRPIILAEVEETAEFTDCEDVKASGATESGVYTITPPGSEPMEVYCDMITDGGGWVVFQRRQDGTENFERLFEDYAQGFGDKEGEFWLGNAALQTLTATGEIDLRIDMWDWDGEHKYATYAGFRITGDDFVLSFDDGSYKGNAGDSLSYHNGMGFTTRDHDVDGSSGGNCAVWLYSGWWFNFCHRANLNGHYKNRLDAIGAQRDQGIQWTDWKGFEYSLARTEMKLRHAKKRGAPGDYAANCAEVLAAGTTLSGVYTVDSPGMGPVDVYCDMDTDEGGWTVFQRRQNGLTSFDADFRDFAQGFGEAADEFWLGNYALRNMTDSKFGRFELRIDMWDWDDEHRYAKYQDFSVTGDDFTLNIGEYSGDAGDSLTFHNGMGFTTRDRDVDAASGGNCAVWLYSGWWFNYCHRANLNGRYKNELDAVEGQTDQGIQWTDWKGFNYSLKKAEMKFRPIM